MHVMFIITEGNFYEGNSFVRSGMSVKALKAMSTLLHINGSA